MALALIGVYRAGGILAILAMLVSTVSITINGKDYAIIPWERVRAVIGGVSLLGGFGYFLYTSFM